MPAPSFYNECLQASYGELIALVVEKQSTLDKPSVNAVKTASAKPTTIKPTTAKPTIAKKTTAKPALTQLDGVKHVTTKSWL